MKSTTPRKVNYRILNEEVNNLVCIAVLEKKYEGVKFHFGKVGTFGEGEDVGVKFQFTIDEGDDTLEENDEFKEIVANILFDIVVGKDNEN